MFNIRGAINLTVVVIILTVAVLGGYWFWTTNNNSVEAGWKQYRNEKLKMAFNYPEDWFIQEKTDQSNPYITIRNYDLYPTFVPGTQYPELPNDFQVISISTVGWNQFIDNNCRNIQPDYDTMKLDGLINCLKSNEQDESAQLVEYKYIGELHYEQNIYQFVTYQPVDFGKQFILYTISEHNTSVITLSTRLDPTSEQITQNILGTLKPY